ncbi:hypothetical protein MSG28_000697 [Choristoneura fumiferana]|uniref:Uncharacterized protein n=1 Tax=Choristoneura fumiferana TaxID=7141 RepID=A0ACC0K225_CHOFU|nr:hypothetical protein MSG28_000697 [Choristoneura fumiferana]
MKVIGKHKSKNRDEELYKLFKKFAKRIRKDDSSDEDETSNNKKKKKVNFTFTQTADLTLTEVITQPTESVDPVEGPEVQSLDPETSAGPSLDEGILEILGEDPNKNKKYSNNIHKDISSRWSHTIQSGLEKLNKDI